MDNIIKQRIQALRTQMRSMNISACIIPSSDCHLSEYVNDCFKFREYFSGFTGSAGTLFITLSEAFLITDGRYFLQALRQLSQTGIKLVRQGEPGEPNIFDLCAEFVKPGEKVFADTSLISDFLYCKLSEKLAENGIFLETFLNPVTTSVTAFPCRTFGKIISLPYKLTGRSRRDKITEIQSEMVKSGAQAHVICSLEEIAWIFNLRGSDIKDSPVFYSFACFTLHDVYLFADTEAVADVARELADDGVTVLPYSDIYSFLSKLTASPVLIDKRRVNARITASLPRNIKTVCRTDPTILIKAVKNPVEIENLKEVHLYDGVALTRFMNWIKTVRKDGITELSASEKLLSFRKMSEKFLGDSFDTIAAYGENAAIVHYSATSESNAQIKNSGSLLVDSGGQYIGGTTDVTRVFILGDTTEEFRMHYTTVCKSMLRLQNAVFPQNTKCAVLDMLVRAPLWQLGIDFKHGTGHGIGYMLCVHEGPNSIHYSNFEPSFKAGMVTSDEPGVYMEGRHGIRLENELLCTEAFRNANGTFLCFQPLTVCPIDLDAIDPSLLDESDRNNINRYHDYVYRSLSPLMTEDEQGYLRYLTRQI